MCDIALICVAVCINTPVGHVGVNLPPQLINYTVLLCEWQFSFEWPHAFGHLFQALNISCRSQIICCYTQYVNVTCIGCLFTSTRFLTAAPTAATGAVRFSMTLPSFASSWRITSWDTCSCNTLFTLKQTM